MSKVVFKIDKEKDKEMILWFSNNPVGLDGVDRFERAMRLIPQLKNLRNFDEEERKKRINAVVDWIYGVEKEKMERGIKEIRLIWQEKEKDFLEKASKIFDNYGWPKGQFVGYPTILAIFPRNIKERTFQTSYRNTELSIQVIMHETLHFIFFEYFKENFDGRLEEKGLWELSEILNDMIMARPPLSELYNHPLKVRESLAKKTKELARVYDKSNSMHDFIEKAITFLKNKQHNGS